MNHHVIIIQRTYRGYTTRKTLWKLASSLAVWHQRRASIAAGRVTIQPAETGGQKWGPRQHRMDHVSRLLAMLSWILIGPILIMCASTEMKITQNHLSPVEFLLILFTVVLGGAVGLQVALQNPEAKVVSRSSMKIFFSCMLVYGLCVGAGHIFHRLEYDAYKEVLMDEGAIGRYLALKGVNRWRLDQSTFFAMTVISTVGYGSPAPSTTGGRIFTVVLACVGIPMFLIHLSIFTTGVRQLVWFSLNLSFEEMSRLYHRRTATKPRSLYEWFESQPRLWQSLLLFTMLLFAVAHVMLHGLYLFREWFEKDPGNDVPYPRNPTDDWGVLYFTIVTLTTVGLGDLSPTGHAMTFSSFTRFFLFLSHGLATINALFQVFTDKIENIVLSQPASPPDDNIQVQTLRESLTGCTLADSVATKQESDRMVICMNEFRASKTDTKATHSKSDTIVL